MEQQVTTRTIARLPGCVVASACRSGFLHCFCETPVGAEFRLLRPAPHGAVEALPFGDIADDWNGIAVRPDGNAVFTCHECGEVWMHNAPWASSSPELVMDGQRNVCGLEVCEEG
jgi:hypothetical protein